MGKLYFFMVQGRRPIDLSLAVVHGSRVIEHLSISRQRCRRPNPFALPNHR